MGRPCILHLFRQMSKEREQEVFNETMSIKGSFECGGERENGLKGQRERQATKRSLETSEETEERLAAKRQLTAF